MLQFSIKFGKGKLLSIFFMPWILQFIYCYRLSGKPSIDPGTDDKLREMPFQPQHLCLWQGLPVSLVLYQLLSFMSTNLDFAGPFWGELNCHGHHVSTADILSSCRTWRGSNGEEWSSAQGLESILISIQSLLSSNPYENEPGYEDASSKPDQDNMKNYAAKVKCYLPKGYSMVVHLLTANTCRSAMKTSALPSSSRSSVHWALDQPK